MHVRSSIAILMSTTKCFLGLAKSSRMVSLLINHISKLFSIIRNLICNIHGTPKLFLSGYIEYP